MRELCLTIAAGVVVAILSTPDASAADVEQGTYRAVFTSQSGGKSTNNCGMLTIDYANGHQYRYGRCNSAMNGIADGAKVEKTSDITVGTDQIKIISATYDIIEAKRDQMIGEWKLNNFHNPFLVFKRIE